MLNISKQDVFNNTQQKLDKVHYNHFNMYATIDKGKYRKKQEDSVAILTHPMNEAFKCIVLADGMGGLEYGALASNLAVKEMICFFERMPQRYFFSEKSIINDMNQKLKEIDSLIRKKYIVGGTTLSAIFVCCNNTVMSTVGDSRIYIKAQDNNFLQVSKDHSLSWELYEKGIILNKDDLRFHKKNNLITSKLGGEKVILTIDTGVLYNNDYSSIYIFSDGVTDCLSETNIDNIINNSKKEYVTQNIVDTAINSNSYNSYLSDDEYYNKIDGGKDNATAACYIKRKR